MKSPAAIFTGSERGKIASLVLTDKKGACLDLTLQGFHCVSPFQATAGVLSRDIKS